MIDIWIASFRFTPCFITFLTVFYTTLRSQYIFCLVATRTMLTLITPIFSLTLIATQILRNTTFFVPFLFTIITFFKTPFFTIAFITICTFIFLFKFFIEEVTTSTCQAYCSNDRQGNGSCYGGTTKNNPWLCSCSYVKGI